VLLSQQRC